MTQLIFNRDEELASWAEMTFPEIGHIARPCHSIGVASNEGELLAVAIYANFGQNAAGQTYDLQITFAAASTRWATKGNIRAILHYPFVQLGVKRMTAITDKTNKKARKLLEGIGFRLEGVHPYGADGKKPACTYGLYSDKAMEWLNG